MGDKLTIGQTLWFVPGDRRGSPHECCVVRVGRKWAELDNRYRIDIETMQADGGGYVSPGRVWRSREEHEAYLALYRAWEALHGRLRHQHRPPKGCTLDTIQTVERLLFGEPT